VPVSSSHAGQGDIHVSDPGIEPESQPGQEDGIERGGDVVGIEVPSDLVVVDVGGDQMLPGEGEYRAVQPRRAWQEGDPPVGHRERPARRVLTDPAYEVPPRRFRVWCQVPDACRRWKR
jgi:hypothetical protein